MLTADIEKWHFKWNHENPAVTTSRFRVERKRSIDAWPYNIKELPVENTWQHKINQCLVFKKK